MTSQLVLLGTTKAMKIYSYSISSKIIFNCVIIYIAQKVRASQNCHAPNYFIPYLSEFITGCILLCVGLIVSLIYLLLSGHVTISLFCFVQIN